MSRFNIPGLLGALGELPSVINRGLLGPLPVNPQLGLDPTMVRQAEDTALNDMAFGMIAGHPMGGGAALFSARQNARDNFSGRMVEILREQEFARMNDERKKEDARKVRLGTLAEAALPGVGNVLSSGNQEDIIMSMAMAKPEELPDKVQVALWLNNNDKAAAQKWLMGQENQGAQTPEKWRLAMLATNGNEAEARKLVLQGFNGDNSTSVQQYILGKLARGEPLNPGEQKVYQEYMLKPDFMMELIRTLGGGSPAVGFDNLPSKP
jgi:hypothetical protein